MSLTPRYIEYREAHLSTYHDITAFMEDLKHLLDEGYLISVEVSAVHISSLRDDLHVQPQPSTSHQHKNEIQPKQTTEEEKPPTQSEYYFPLSQPLDVDK